MSMRCFFMIYSTFGETRGYAVLDHAACNGPTREADETLVKFYEEEI